MFALPESTTLPRPEFNPLLIQITSYPELYHRALQAKAKQTLLSISDNTDLRFPSTGLFDDTPMPSSHTSSITGSPRFPHVPIRSRTFPLPAHITTPQDEVDESVSLLPDAPQGKRNGLSALLNSASPNMTPALNSCSIAQPISPLMNTQLLGTSLHSLGTSLHSPPDSFHMRRRSSFSWKNRPPSICAGDTFTLSPGPTRFTDDPLRARSIHERYMLVPPFLSPVDTPVEGSPNSPGSLETHMGQKNPILQSSEVQTQTERNATQLNDGNNGKELFRDGVLFTGSVEERTNADGSSHPAYGVTIDEEEDDCQGSVERTISAVMSNESHSRSRKTTQSLRLFKENDAEDRMKKDDRIYKETNRAKERMQDRNNTLLVTDTGFSGIAFPSRLQLQRLNSESLESNQNFEETNTHVTNSVHRKDTVPAHPDLKLEKQIHERSLNDPFDETRTTSQISPKSCLKSSADVGSGPSNSDTVPPTLNSGPKTKSTSFLEGEIRRTQLSFVDGSEDESRKITITAKKTEVHDEADEESEKDEISSALYIPHTTPSLPPVRIKDAMESLQLGEDGHEVEEFSLEDTRRISEIGAGRREVQEECRHMSETGVVSPHGDEALGYSTDTGATTSASESEDFSDRDSDRENWVDEPLPVIKGDGDGETASHVSVLGTPNGLDTVKGHSPLAEDDSKKRNRRHHSRYYHAQAPTEPQVPLGAVELKPYNHQVGGHTALFRFSRRAVCKSLSNRENEFYEAIETRHPSLLKFLPK